MTLLHPKRIPQKLQRERSNLYARLFTLVKIFASWVDMPSGAALRFFFVVGRPKRFVAGTVSK